VGLLGPVASLPPVAQEFAIDRRLMAADFPRDPRTTFSSVPLGFDVVSVFFGEMTVLTHWQHLFLAEDKLLISGRRLAFRQLLIRSGGALVS